MAAGINPLPPNRNAPAAVIIQQCPSEPEQRSFLPISAPSEVQTIPEQRKGFTSQPAAARWSHAGQGCCRGPAALLSQLILLRVGWEQLEQVKLRRVPKGPARRTGRERASWELGSFPRAPCSSCSVSSESQHRAPSSSAQRVLLQPRISSRNAVSPAQVELQSIPQCVAEAGLLHPWYQHDEGDMHSPGVPHPGSQCAVWVARSTTYPCPGHWG